MQEIISRLWKLPDARGLSVPASIHSGIPPWPAGRDWFAEQMIHGAQSKSHLWSQSYQACFRQMYPHQAVLFSSFVFQGIGAIERDPYWWNSSMCAFDGVLKDRNYRYRCLLQRKVWFTLSNIWSRWWSRRILYIHKARRGFVQNSQFHLYMLQEDFLWTSRMSFEGILPRLWTPFMHRLLSYILLALWGM